eukprot:m.234062 g.234062  ORF g.234062 m.234062 type:complete len:51 (-) comp19310_c1_seq1:1174-1326(-)
MCLRNFDSQPSTLENCTITRLFRAFQLAISTTTQGLTVANLCVMDFVLVL